MINIIFGYKPILNNAEIALMEKNYFSLLKNSPYSLNDPHIKKYCLINVCLFLSSQLLAQLAGAAEYTDCISTEG